MTAPQRIQLSRQKGFRLPENSVSVARPTKFGNTFRVLKSAEASDAAAGWYVDDGVGVKFFPEQRDAAQYAVNLFRSDLMGGRLSITADDVRRELAGKHLACWCKPGDPCHADDLLELANHSEMVTDSAGTEGVAQRLSIGRGQQELDVIAFLGRRAAGTDGQVHEELAPGRAAQQQRPGNQPGIAVERRTRPCFVNPQQILVHVGSVSH